MLGQTGKGQARETAHAAAGQSMKDNKILTTIRKKLHQQLPLLAKQYKVKTLAVFGSYVHHEQNTDSDLDLLVTFSETPGLLKFIELENYLTDLLGTKVDLVMQSALKPKIGQRILSEVVPV